MMRRKWTPFCSIAHLCTRCVMWDTEQHQAFRAGMICTTRCVIQQVAFFNKEIQMNKNSVEENMHQPKDCIARTSPADDECGLNAAAQSRRSVLRGMFAVGCGLLLPAALFNTRDASAETASPAAKKVTQASAQYQTKPKGDQKCSTCANFIAASGTCNLVEGKISPDDWCGFWTKKT